MIERLLALLLLLLFLIQVVSNSLESSVPNLWGASYIPSSETVLLQYALSPCTTHTSHLLSKADTTLMVLPQLLVCLITQRAA